MTIAYRARLSTSTSTSMSGRRIVRIIRKKNLKYTLYLLNAEQPTTVTEGFCCARYKLKMSYPGYPPGPPGGGGSYPPGPPGGYPPQPQGGMPGGNPPYPGAAAPQPGQVS